MRRITGWLAAGALVLAGCGGGFDGDPYATVLDAAERSLELPIELEVTLAIDAAGLADVAREAGERDAAGGFAMFGDELEVVARVGLREDAALLEVQLGGDLLAEARVDEGEHPLVRIDPEVSRQLPFLGFVRGFAPDLFTGDWVEIVGRDVQPFTFGGDLDQGLAELRRELADVSDGDLRDQFVITHEDDDGDGWRFRVVPGPGAGEDLPDEAGFDLWVDDDRLARLRLDVLHFVPDEELGTIDRARAEGMAVVDVRRGSVNIPARPTPNSTFDVDGFAGF